MPSASEVQIDYGKAGYLFDPWVGKNKSVYVFIATLSFSRHKYVEFTFRDREQPQLKPLPPQPFDIAQWKQAKVHPDHYIQFNNKAYSVPPGYRQTDVNDFPPNVQAMLNKGLPLLLQQKATAIGPPAEYLHAIVDAILDRLAHHSHQIILKGESYRKKFKPKLQNA